MDRGFDKLNYPEGMNSPGIDPYGRSRTPQRGAHGHFGPGEGGGASNRGAASEGRKKKRRKNRIKSQMIKLKRNLSHKINLKREMNQKR